ncbi:MAG: ABC transporter ATP-binding protein [Dehalococcoidia bacterium]
MGFGIGGGRMGSGMGLGGFNRSSLMSSDLAHGEQDFGKAFDPRLYRRLWRYIAPFKLRLSVSLMLMVVYTGAQIAQPLLIKSAVDRAIIPRDAAVLTGLVIAYVAVSAASWLAQYQQVYLMTYVGQHALFRLASDLFEHIQSLSLSFFDQNETGRIMARVQNDVSVLQQLLQSGIISIFSNALLLAGILVTLFLLNWRLALVTCAVLPLMVGLTAVWRRFARQSFRRSRAAISAVNASLQENVSGVRVIQSLSRERHNARQFDEVNRHNRDVNVGATRISALLLPLVEVVSALAMASVVVVGGTMVLNGTIALGAVVAFTVYINTFFDPIRDLVQIYSNLQRATVAGERIFEVLDTQSEVRDRPGAIALPPVQGEVSFEHVEFSYIEGIPVLRDLNLLARPGESVALVGHTGAGKSTVISLLTRFYDVSGGRITIDGHDIRDVTMHSLRRQVAVVLQDPVLFSGTVADNIRFSRPEATAAEVEAAARLVGLHDLVMRLELGYDTPIRERGSNLSMGQRQLISFARAVVAQPRILVLDEATANIDTATEHVIQEGLHRLLAGRTSFVIAHRLATIKNADHIVVLDAGRVAEEGTHNALMARRGAYYTLYSMGFETAAPARIRGGMKDAKSMQQGASTTPIQ